MRHYYPVLITIIFQLFPKAGLAVEIMAGLGGVDQGDDIQRPAAIIEVKIDSATFAGGFTYGRSFSGVKETATIINYGWQKDLFGPLPIAARVGISLLDEETKIHNPNIADEEHNYNLGAFLGASYTRQFGRYVVQGVWDSHLYPAGLNGFILLATGRKQMIGMMVGVSL